MTYPSIIHHVNVMVDDLVAADAFYGDVLGLERVDAPDLGFPAQFFKVNDEQELHVNELDDGKPERAHFCLRVPDFDATFARVRDLDIIETETWGRVRRLPTGVMQCFVRDPSGNLIELSTSPGQPVDPAMFDLDFVEPDEQFFHRSS
ncbi:MAG: VOC family protein [Acidimicrobiia bacterium]|nr:VOC family protein [Acidimicrobiia bacterium]